jgi:cytochrome bd ubiquinol oxidase subunit I
MNIEILSRLQFAMTIGFHFFFPPITIGLAWILVIIEGLGWRRNDEAYVKLGKFFARLLALTFAVGVATGIVMEFQFGTNWSEYSKFVGDIFGAPLAAEGVFAFFLESGFLGLYLFGRSKVSKAIHWFSIFMVAVGSTISAFWIIVANSWQQTPAGYILRNGRAELTNFFDAVFNPSTLIRFFHTVDAALITGAFFVAGISAYLIRKNIQKETAKKSLRVAVIFGLAASLMEVFPFGHEHSVQVAKTQPEKFAAIMGLYRTQSAAPLTVFAVPAPPVLKAAIEIPGFLSFLVYGDTKYSIKGINEFPQDEIPPLFLTFVSYHNMVALGMLFISLLGWATIQLYRKKLWKDNLILKLLTWAIPFPPIACQLGWITAEVGRQPWIVYKLMKTKDAFSVTVSSGEILISIILLGIIYLILGILYIYLLRKEVKHGPEALTQKEVAA